MLSAVETVALPDTLEVAAPPIAPSSPELSIVMPCLNEARTVSRCVEKALRTLHELGINGEVVVSDNGSTDDSVELAERAGARVVHQPLKGYGNALRKGFAEARGRYIIMGDCDDSYDFTDLGRFVEHLRQGADVVMGNRFKGEIKPGAMPWLHRYVGNPVLTGILNLFFRTPIRDAHCGMRGFRKDACAQLGLSSPGMEFASEMVVKAVLQGLTMTEVPITLHPDGRDRPPHLRSFRDGWRHLRFLLLMCPLWLYLVPAAILIVGGFGTMAWLTPGPRMVGRVVLDIHTMLFGALCVQVGYQTAGLWAYAKIYGWTRGLLPPSTFSKRIFDYLNLERGILAGTAKLLIGLGLILWLVLEWGGREIGPLDLQVTMRYALWGFTTMVLGIQTIYGSFFLSMLGMRRE